MGSHSSGHLGLGTNVMEMPIPNLLSLHVLQNESVSKIACGESHSAISTSESILLNYRLKNQK